MRVLLDTSVLVAALVRSHPHHEVSNAWLRAIHDERHQGVMSAHSLAETYAILTRLPLQPRISADEAWRLIERDLIGTVEAVSLDAEQYAALIRELAANGLTGGVIYDAVILRAGGIAGTESVLTFNTADFSRLAQVLGGVVASPYQLSV